MTTLMPTFLPKGGFLSCIRRGWIGVDVGSASLKLAQIQWTDQRPQIVARWSFEFDAPVEEGAAKIQPALTACLPQLKRARRGFQGSLCAASLSLGASDLRSFDLPAANEEELDCMIREELQADSESAVEELCFDSWVADHKAPTAAGTQVSVLTIPRKVAETLTTDLYRARLDCVVLDGMPCALARAATLLPEQGAAPLVVVDLGFSSATVVLAMKGRPAFSRQLRGCGIASFLAPLQSRLQLTSTEARHLLMRLGVAPPPTSSGKLPALNATHQLLAEPLAHLQAELRRTLGYLDQRFRAFAPQAMVLLGGGTLVPHLPHCLEMGTGLPTRPWRLDSDGSSNSDPLFGVAAALSALAWENSPCT